MQRQFEVPSSDDAEVLQTEYDFELPLGYRDGSGVVHTRGTMRLATARDELVPLVDDRVRENPAYLTVVLLARVLVRVGDIQDIHPGIVENFFAADLAYLQDLYVKLNQEGTDRVPTTCPACDHSFSVKLTADRLGEPS
jgi:hypothetical protein